MRRIHIIGSGPRTGTTLLHEVMISCFDIDCYSEHEARIHSQEPVSGNIYLTKHPSDYYAVNLPLKFNSQLYVLCMIRDPRDAVVSKHNSHPDIYWAGLRYWKLFLEYWTRLNKHERFIAIKYENLVTDPDSVQDFIQTKLDFLKKNNNFSDYHNVVNPGNKSINALNGIRSINPLGIGNWKNHIPRLVGQIKLHGDISEDLIYFQYEKDKLWLNLLDGIEGDFSKSYWPEYFSDKDLKKRKFAEKIELVNIFLRKIGVNTSRITMVIKNKIRKK